MKYLAATLALVFPFGCMIDDAAFDNPLFDDRELTSAQCQDTNDNDADGAIDCDDPDCWDFDFCLDEDSEDVDTDTFTNADTPTDSDTKINTDTDTPTDIDTDTETNTDTDTGTDTDTDSPTDGDTETNTDTDTGTDTDTDSPTDGDTETDTDTDTDTDTGTDTPTDSDTESESCALWLTAEECLAENGAFDPRFLAGKCIEDFDHFCCIADALSNPCPFECSGAADCQDRGGYVTDHTLGYQCSHPWDRCCEGAAPADTDPASFYEDPFDPATDCPLSNTDTDPSNDFPTIGEQPDEVASGVCLELPQFNEAVTPLADQPYFCPQEDYDRIEREIAQIKADYPWTAADAGGQIINGMSEMVEPFVMLCVAGVQLPAYCVDFPKGGFEEIMQCYGGVYEKCLFENEAGDTCNQMHMMYDVAANTKKMLAAYETQANALVPGSLCELNGYIGVDFELELNGFHVTGVDEASGIWAWEIRSTSTFYLGVAHCDVVTRLYSRPDPLDPTKSIINLMPSTPPLPPAIENRSDSECLDPVFLNAGQ